MSQEHNELPEDDVQMPLNTGGGGIDIGAEEYSGDSKPRVNGSTLALIAAFAAALGVLYLLGLQNKPRAASAEEVKRSAEIDNRIRNILDNKNSSAQVDSFLKDSARLIEMLDSYFKYGPRAADIGANPFERDLPPAPAFGMSTNPVQHIITEDPVRAALLRSVAEEFAGMKVQMVMLGSPSAAVINGKMVYTGQQIMHFTVTDIQADRVLLGFEKQTFELKVNAPRGQQ